MNKKKIDFIKITTAMLGLSLALCGMRTIGFQEYFSLDAFEIVNLFLYEAFIVLLAFVIQIIMHELGHLVFGLLSGYEFVSFRVGSLMLVKTNGKFELKKYSLANIVGQCLLTVDKDIKGNFPFVLYLLGGVISNTIFSTLCFIAGILASNYYIRLIMYVMAICGYYIALTNGVPYTINGTPNDGKNIVDCLNDKNIRDCLYVQLKVCKHLSDGKRYKDIDDELLNVGSNVDKNNILVRYVLVVRQCKLFDQLNFDLANKLINELLNDYENQNDINSNILKLDKLIIDLINNKLDADTSVLYTKSMKVFMRSMAKDPCVILTNYVYDKLYLNDEKAANKQKKIFKTIKNSYPYKGQLVALNEMMDYIDTL